MNDIPREISITEKPCRLLSHPIEVEFSGNLLFVDRHFEEVDSIGNKEVVFSDWWEHPIERIYYRLITKSGKHLWLFKCSDGHYLHGIFDEP